MKGKVLRWGLLWLTLPLAFSVSSGDLQGGKDSVPPPSAVGDEELERKIKEAERFYQEKYKSLELEAKEVFDIDFSALAKEFDSKMKELELKSSVLNAIQDRNEREEKLKLLNAEYQDERFYRYIESYYYLQNEMEKDHEFVGKLLSMLEGILNQVIEKDPLFQYVFYSPEFRSRYGLVLKRVVWQGSQLKNVSGETEPLRVHSVFGNKSRIPILMKLTPHAFTSLAFLRSILVHELNHVYFYKDRRYADVKQFSGIGRPPGRGEFSHYFRQLNPYQPDYQYQLLNEYYSFRAQIAFDDRVKDRAYFELPEAERKNLEKTLEWIDSQLNPWNKMFVERNPDPPILELIRRFY